LRDKPSIQGIVRFLTSDKEMKTIYSKFCRSEHFDGNRFQSNFRRILRQFSTDLRKELGKSLERVPIFILSYNGAIAGGIWSVIDEQNGAIPNSLLQPLDP